MVQAQKHQHLLSQTCKLFFLSVLGILICELNSAIILGSLDAICFNAFDTEIGPTLENHNGRSLHLCGKLDINQWRGQRSVQLRLEDAQFAV